MVNKEIYSQIADIVHSVDDWEIHKEHFTNPEWAEEDIAVADWLRAEYRWNLMLKCDGDTRREHIGYVEPEDPDDPEDPFYYDGPDRDHLLNDPLVFALRVIAGQIRALQARQRELIAFGREFAPPGHKYTLEQLASAAGMSVSGVRTSYNKGTIDYVAKLLELGADKRDAMCDPRWVAVHGPEYEKWYWEYHKTSAPADQSPHPDDPPF